jgi:hypothetical protein
VEENDIALYNYYAPPRNTTKKQLLPKLQNSSEKDKKIPDQN